MGLSILENERPSRVSARARRFAIASESSQFDPSPAEPSQVPDASLLARARAGDRAALQRLCDQLEPHLRAACARQLGQLQDKVRVSDVLQSTFVDIVRSVAQIPDTNSEACVHWGLRVLENNIRDLARYHNANRRDRSLEQRLVSDESIGLAAQAPSPATEMVQAEDLTRLGMAIAELSPDYQRILQLFMRAGFSHESAARSQGRSVGASRVLLARARAALLAKLDDRLV